MSAAVAAAAAAALSSRRPVSSSSTSVQYSHQYPYLCYRSLSGLELSAPPAISRYESQKRQDWNTFVQYLRNHRRRRRPPLKLSRCDGNHVIEFLRHLSQTKTQASLDGLIGRLRVAFEENGGPPETNPFCSDVVRLYLEEVKNGQLHVYPVEL